jgi:hypothetical protein
VSCKYQHLNAETQVELLFSKEITVTCEKCRADYWPGDKINTIYRGHRDEGILVTDVFSLPAPIFCPKCDHRFVEILFPCDGRGFTHSLFDKVDTTIELEKCD